MKRSVHLQPLSRQHHNGLLAALLVGKGLKKGAGLQVMATFIIYVWQHELQSHFEQEEQILIPALQNTSFDPSLTQQLLQEHRQIQSFVQQMQSGNYNSNDITSFASLLEKHIRFEERIYFPEAEKVLSVEVLEQIGVQLHEDPSGNCMNYPVKFWE
jgi:hemerythrin-like domain-containing protein